MTSTTESWHEEVQSAALVGDQDALRRLFAQAHELFGEQASERWAEAMSGLDASAQTG